MSSVPVPPEHNEAAPIDMMGLELADIEEGVAAGFRGIDTVLRHSEELFLAGQPSEVFGKTSLIPYTYLHEHYHDEKVLLPEQARRIQEAVIERLRDALKPDEMPEAVQTTDYDEELEVTRWTADYKKHKLFFYEERITPVVDGTTGLEFFIANYEPEEMKRLFTPDRKQQRRQEHAVQGGVGSLSVARFVDDIKQRWEAQRSPKRISQSKSLKSRRIV